MGIEIPGAVRWLVPIVVGDDWPEGDETSLRRLGETWSDVGRAVDAIGHDGDDAVRAALAAITGDTNDALADYWQKVGGDGAIGDLITLCEKLGDACDNTALDIEHAKLSIIAALIALAAELAAMAAAAVVTLGASSAGAVAAEVATQVTVRMILKELLMQVIKHALIDGLTEFAIDGGVQAIQFANGDRHDVDGGSLWKSFYTGAAEGAATAGLGKEGLGQFVPGLGDGIGRTVVREAGIETVAGMGGSVASTLAGGDDVDWKTFTSGGIGGAVEGTTGGLETARPDVSGLSRNGLDGDEPNGTPSSTASSAQRNPNGMGDNGTSGTVTSAASDGAGGRPDAMPDIDSGGADSSAQQSVEATPDSRSAAAGGPLGETASHSLLSDADANSSPLQHDSGLQPSVDTRPSSLNLGPENPPQPSGLSEPSSAAPNVESPAHVDAPATVSTPAAIANVEDGQTHSTSTTAPVEARSAQASVPPPPPPVSTGPAPVPAMTSSPSPAPAMTGPPPSASSPWTPPVNAPSAPIAPVAPSAPSAPSAPITPVAPSAPVPTPAMTGPAPAMTGPLPAASTPLSPPSLPGGTPIPAPVPAPTAPTPGPSGAGGHSVVMAGAPAAALVAGAAGVHHRAGPGVEHRPGHSGLTHDSTSADGHSAQDRSAGPGVTTEDGESHRVTWSREQLEALSSAQDVIAHELRSRGISPGDFQQLMSQPVENLTPEQQRLLHDVRLSIPLPDADTVLQKVLGAESAERLLNNDVVAPFRPNGVGGCVTVAADTVGLRSPEAIIDGLRLDYAGTPFHADSPVFAVRFTASDGDLAVPNGRLTEILGLEPTLDLRHPYPYTGTGYTASMANLVPEYSLDEGRMRAGSEMWQIDPDGTETLVGVLGRDKEWHRVLDND